MKYAKTLQLLCLVLCFELLGIGCCLAQPNSITPAPNIEFWGDKCFDASERLTLSILGVTGNDLTHLRGGIDELGLSLKEAKRPAKNNYINLRIVPITEIAEASTFERFDEGYLLDITPQGIDIKATTPQGLYYGIQSLKALTSTQSNSPLATSAMLHVSSTEVSSSIFRDTSALRSSLCARWMLWLS